MNMTDKRETEQRAVEAVKQLLHVLKRNFVDTGIILDQFEETHSESELEESKHYGALVAGYFGLGEVIDKIKDILK